MAAAARSARSCRRRAVRCPPGSVTGPPVGRLGGGAGSRDCTAPSPGRTRRRCLPVRAGPDPDDGQVIIVVEVVIAVVIDLVAEFVAVGGAVAPDIEQFGFEEELVAEREQRGDDVLAGVVVPVAVVGARARVRDVTAQRHPIAWGDGDDGDVRRGPRSLDLAGDGARIDHDVEHRAVLRVLLAAAQA